MNRIFRFFSVIAIVFVAFSCVKTDDNDPINPPAGEDQVLWKFSLSDSIGLENVKSVALPAYDEANNGYYLLNVENPSSSYNEIDVYVVALDASGTLKWHVKATDLPIDPSNESFIASTEGKIIVFMTEKLLCLDAESGNTAWSNDMYRTYWVNSMSVADGKIFYIDGTDITEKIVGINLTDGSEFCRLAINVPGEDIRGELTMIAGGKLHVLTNDINNNNQWLSQLVIYDISLLPSDSPVAYTTPLNFYPVTSVMAATSSGSALFFMKNEGNSDPVERYLVSVNSQGTENWRAEVPSDVSDIYIDAAENIYCIGPNEFLRFSATGAKIFEAEIPFATYLNEFELLESSLFYGVTGNPETGEEDNIFTVFDLPTFSEQLRYGEYYPYAQIEGSSAQIYEENYRRLGENAAFSSGKKVVDRTGKLISVSHESIYCVNTFENKLMPNAWSKRFGDYGNTNSR